jgi:hypothetical protein
LHDARREHDCKLSIRVRSRFEPAHSTSSHE